MQVDQRFVQNLQNENGMLRQEIGRLNGIAQALDQKYQKALKQMSSIIHANQSLKQQLDSLKVSIKDQIQNSIREIRVNYEKRIEQMIIEKNDIYVNNQNLTRQKQQLQRDYASIERNLWETEALKNQISALKKQNEKLLLQTHPLTQNKENPQQKNVQQKLSQKIQQLNGKIIQLNVQSTQSRKYAESVQSQKQALQKENQNLLKKINDLNLALEKASSESHKSQKGELENKILQNKRYQMQVLELRKQNADLTNEIERLKLQNLEKTSQINKNQAQLHLLSTLKSLHSQLQPMRYEIEQLKRDKYFERQNTNKQKGDLQMKLLSCQHQIQTLKQHIKDLQIRNKDLSQQIREKQWQKYRFQQIEQEKRILQGRVIVYEAMEMVSRNREKPHHVQRLQQFQRRIQLLLQQQNLQYLVNNANVHQLIAMKAYVIQLDNKLQTVIQQNQHFHKKYSQYKDKYKQLISENKQIVNKHYSMINAYKGKIAGYQKLVMKLTQQLQRYIKESEGPSSIQSHYKSVITLYESKILSVYNQFTAKKQEHRDILKKYENLELQFKGKIGLIRQIQTELSQMKSKNNQLSNKLATKSANQQPRNSFSNIPQDHYKSIITQKTKQILELQQNLSKIRFKMDKLEFQHDRDLQNYKHKISRLQIQIQQLRLQLSQTNKQISTAKHSQQFGQLVSKLSNLQRNVAAMSKSQVIMQQSQQPIDNVTDLRRQIQNLYRENKELIQQLQNFKRELKDRVNAQNVAKAQSQMNNAEQLSKVKDLANKTILDLQNRINQLDTQLKIKIKGIQIRQKQYSRVLQDSTVNLQPKPVHNYSLQQQNIRLRDELERIKTNSKAMAQQSEGLMIKIRQTQTYISNLKVQFNSVSSKMSQYEKQLNIKDNQLNQWRLKYNNLQQQYENQLKNLKSNSNYVNDKQNQQKIRKIKEMQLQIQRSQRQLQSKFRDLQRRQMQANRRQTQIDSKNRDFKDRLRKVEQRQKIVSDQETRLINWSRQIQQSQRNYRQMLNIPIPSNNYSPPKPLPQNYEQKYHQLQKKYKIIQIQLAQKIKIIQAKDDKMNKLIRQKVQFTKQLQDLKINYQQKARLFDFNERQAINLKQQCARLQGQLEKLWKQFDLLKQQIRVKQRQLSDSAFQKEQLQRKFTLQIKQLNFRIKQLQSSKISSDPTYLPPKTNSDLDYHKLESQFQQKLRQIQQRNRLKIKQIYNQNEQNTKQLFQRISDLNAQLSRYKYSSPSQNKNEIQSHTAAIQSLQSHIKILQEQIRRKQTINVQLQDHINYYKSIISQREQQIQKLYESQYAPSTHVPSTSGQFDNMQKIRLQNQIIALQTILKNRGNQEENHEQCIKKQHLLRMQIQRLSGILQSKLSQSQTAKPLTPKSNFLDNSYLNELQQTNKQLQQDLAIFKQRLLAQFDEKRNIEDYLAVLVLTFAEVDALRQRIYQLQQNFKQQHDRQLNVFKQFQELKQHNVDVQKVMDILKQLEVSHRIFHEQQQRSKSTFIKRINTQVLVMPGSQSISINDELNKLKIPNQTTFRNVTEVSDSTKQYGSFQLSKIDESSLINKLRPSQPQQRSIKYSLNQDSGKLSNIVNLDGNIGNNYSSFTNSHLVGPTTPIPNNNYIQPSFGGSFNSNINPPLTNYNFMSSGYNNPPLTNLAFTSSFTNQNNFKRYGSYQGQPKIQFGTTIPQFTTPFPSNLSATGLNRPNNFPFMNQPIPQGGSPVKFGDSSFRRQEFSPTKAQPHRYYQNSQGSQSSLRFSSEANLIGATPITFGSVDSNYTPYIMSNNQLIR